MQCDLESLHYHPVASFFLPLPIADNITESKMEAAMPRQAAQLECKVCGMSNCEENLPTDLERHSVWRTIRKNELRKIVPLSDTTIYNMEKRGEFPKRFNLSPRCVVWRLSEIEAWIEKQRNCTVESGTQPRPCPNVQQRKYRPVKTAVRGL